MLWTYNDSGYLVSVDMPERGRCPMCGTEYSRSIEDRKPWQTDGPDACPRCGHVLHIVEGAAFRNAAV